jgi:hypothetical protein
MDRKIYKKLARKHGATTEEVECDLYEAVKIINRVAGTVLKQLVMDLWASVGRNMLVEQNLLQEFIEKDSGKLHEYHWGLGLFLRNNILKSDSDIYKEFVKVGINEKDDMSSLIIHIWHSALQREQ